MTLDYSCFSFVCLKAAIISLALFLLVTILTEVHPPPLMLALFIQFIIRCECLILEG